MCNFGLCIVLDIIVIGKFATLLKAISGIHNSHMVNQASILLQKALLWESFL